jgi:hypothetical protein
MKRALLVGIDRYDTLRKLGGCVNDVRALEPLISRHDDDELNYECVMRVSDEERVDRKVLLDSVDALLSPGADAALLYFAGHGVGVDDDLVLATAETKDENDGVSFAQILGKIHKSKIREIIVVLDCCYSGAAGGMPGLGGDKAILREGLALFSASRPEQTAAESDSGRGVFSNLLCGALEGGAADVLGNVSLLATYAYLSESFGSWDQRPTFKVNVDRSSVLRRSRPAMARKDLRQLAVIFPEAHRELPLRPAYDENAPDHDPKLAPHMSVLRIARSARLVEPVGAEQLYYAVMYGKACRLTPLGKHYWRMVKEGRL